MKLTYASGEHVAKAIDAEGRRMVVGRGADCDVVLPEIHRSPGATPRCEGAGRRPLRGPGRAGGLGRLGPEDA